MVATIYGAWCYKGRLPDEHLFLNLFWGVSLPVLTDAGPHGLLFVPLSHLYCLPIVRLIALG